MAILSAEWISVILVAVAAIVSPVITNIQNNRHSKLMKELEGKDKANEIVEEFLYRYGMCVGDQTFENLQIARGALYRALIYVSEPAKTQMLHLVEMEFDDIGPQLDRVALALAKD